MLNITDLSQAELQAAVKVGSGIQGADTDLAKAYAGHLLTEAPEDVYLLSVRQDTHTDAVVLSAHVVHPQGEFTAAYRLDLSSDTAEALTNSLAA